jgi:dihydroorotate dehydrogenase
MRAAATLIYKKLIRPYLFRMDAEMAHHTITNRALSLQQSDAFLKISSDYAAFRHDSLKVTTSGITFPNPVGLAAGFDKNAELIPALEALGFGFIEAGSITARPSDGNPKPRMFRLPADLAVINRMGLNNQGAEAITERVANTKKSVPLGLNIAKTPGHHKTTADSISDYALSFRLAAPVSDYITLNISCPNTGDGKSFEDPELFRELLRALRPLRPSALPVFVKFSADTNTDTLKMLLRISEDEGIDGYIAVNTSVKRSGLITDSELIQRIGAGGLSGKPLTEEAVKKIRIIRDSVPAGKTVISAGGIFSGTDAEERLREGADLLQIYTGLVYEGPLLPAEICSYLAAGRAETA